MAELRDWLNRKVLYLVSDADAVLVRLVFQNDVFIDNEIGWKVQKEAEVAWYNFDISQGSIDSFVSTAKAWLNLPLDELANTFFSGSWELGSNESVFNIEFGLYEETPSKIDWFTVNIDIRHKNLSYSEKLHVDHSCFNNFVTELESNA